MPSPLVQFRAKQSIIQQLRKRMSSPDEIEGNPEVDGMAYAFHPQNISQVASRDLERYYNALVQNLPRFSYNEAMLIVDALNGYLFQSEIPDAVSINILDAMEMDHLHEKWNVDRDAFTKRLRQLSSFEQLAIGDAIEQIWNPSQGYHISDMQERVIAAGLAEPPAEPTREDRLFKLAQQAGYESIDEYISSLEEDHQGE